MFELDKSVKPENRLVILRAWGREEKGILTGKGLKISGDTYKTLWICYKPLNYIH